jgi:putative transcription antitermination factor YqgF
MYAGYLPRQRPIVITADYEIVFEDERLTSRQAEYILAQTGRKYTKDKKLVDLKSACIILQQYLDRK